MASQNIHVFVSWIYIVHFALFSIGIMFSFGGFAITYLYFYATYYCPFFKFLSILSNLTFSFIAWYDGISEGPKPHESFYEGSKLIGAP